MSLAPLVFVFATGGGAPAPLTQHRAKAALPFGGKYRVIDFPLANCLHSGMRQILVLTQYKSHSLHKHLRDAWSVLHPELGEFITPVPPQMRADGGWYRSARDALRQNRYLIERSPARSVLLLDGEVVYRMDYAALARAHSERNAEATVALRALPLGVGPRVDTLRCDAEERLTAIVPAATRLPSDLRGVDPEAAWTTMGVLLVEKSLLLDTLDHPDSDPGEAETRSDFVLDLLRPLLVARVHGYCFGGERGRVTPDGYWNDLGSIDAYYRANMALLEATPPLDLYQPDWKILTYQGQYPPARTVPGSLSGSEGVFVNSMLAAGTLIRGGGVSHSVLFPRVLVEEGAIVEGAILFDGVRVGAGAELRRCILDKEVVVHPGARLGVEPAADRARFTVSPDGIVVVGKGQEVT